MLSWSCLPKLDLCSIVVGRSIEWCFGPCARGKFKQGGQLHKLVMEEE
jgi:hypothetical protein